MGGNQGFLEQEYLVRREGTSVGRSSVMFCPTSSAAAELEKGESRPPETESEEHLRTHLLEKLDKPGKTGIDSVLREAFEELPNLQNLLPASASDEALLVFLAGLILGIVFKGRSEARALEFGAGPGRPDASYLQLALQDSDQRMELLNLVEMVTKRISSQWALTGEEDRAILMTIADKAMSGALLN